MNVRIIFFANSAKMNLAKVLILRNINLKKDYIPLSYKERAVALAEAHPKWSLKTLQKHGCYRLKDKKRLKQ